MKNREFLIILLEISNKITEKARENVHYFDEVTNPLSAEVLTLRSLITAIEIQIIRTK